ncbi:MAG: hypothetical protein CFH05_00481 [Alphaproteobacteria bacterium MarineAlpha3_Bin4]|nr:MAG: hypothetical protein CFH05_00481 [Alphaproteobacteria bacterium MarineAlpha3_Bin4]
MILVLDDVRFMRDVNLVTSARVYVGNDMVRSCWAGSTTKC